MSLLLEALKKAEKAKEEAQRRARGESEPELKLEAEAPAAPPPPGEPKEVLTRDKLPEIPSQPLEIVPDDLPPPKSAAPPQPEPSRPQPAKGEPPRSDAAGRAAAKKVFEAKFREPNPRLPFYITLGVLGAFAFGTVIYFWYQLRPPPALVNANPPPPANEARVDVAAIPKPPAIQSPLAVAPAAIPGLPETTPPPAPPALPEAVRKPAPPPAELRPKPAAKPRPAPEASRAEPRAEPRPEPRAEPRPEATARRAPPQVHPRVDSGYAAYVSGDYTLARTHYEEALREEPANRDALLGLAALDVKAGRFESAESVYLRLLQADPRDAHAQAALIALRGGRIDPLAAESRVKSLLAAEPAAHVLNFTLGNQLALQGRWGEAQAEYFKAFSAEPENADYAYNLAVSLDHLRQGRLALEYYRRAIGLAAKRGASFDAAAARTRAEQLGK